MLFILAFIVIVNKYLYKSLLNPIFLQSLLWLIYFVILVNNIDSFDIAITETYPFLLLQVLGFSLGGALCFILFKKYNTPTIPQQNKEHEYQHITITNINILYPFVLIILVIVIPLIIRESGSFSLLNIRDLRDTLVEDDGKKYGSYGLLQLLISVYLVTYISTGEKITSKYKLLLIIFFFYTYLLGSRGQFIFFFGSIFYILIWQKRLRKISIVLSVVFLVLLMLLVTISRESDLDTDFLIKTFLSYTTASVPALVLAKDDPALVFGYHSFRVAYLWLNKVGFAFPIVPMLSEWTPTPLLTNVYSYIKPYYYDFGITGIFILPAIIGFINNLLFFRSQLKKQSSLILLAFFTYPLLMQTFDEQYFRWASNWVYIYFLIKFLTTFKLNENRSSNSDLQS